MRTLEEILAEIGDDEDIQFADDYAEPGYVLTDKGIILADWNNIPDNIYEELEELGYDLEYSDEWLIADNGDAVRTSPDSYSWEPSYLVTEYGEILTIKDEPEEWIREIIITDHLQTMSALPSHISTQTLIDLGFSRVSDEEYEHGFHPGQTDKPQDIAEKVFSEGEFSALVFRITEQSQFYIKFELWGE